MLFEVSRVRESAIGCKPLPCTLGLEEIFESISSREHQNPREMFAKTDFVYSPVWSLPARQFI
jgi:hypothetical protein